MKQKFTLFLLALSIFISHHATSKIIIENNYNPSPLDAPTVSLIQPTCDVATGSIEVIAPVEEGYTYSINGVDYQPSPIFSGLDVGDYDVSVYDGVDYSPATSVVINQQPVTPTLAAVGTNPTACGDNGSITLSFTGVTDGNYTIFCDEGDFTGVSVSSNSATLEAPAGTYSNLSINANGCTSLEVVDITLTDPDAPTAPTITVENLCGESVLTASDFTGDLLWSYNNETTESIIVTESGNYSVTQTLYNCTSPITTKTAEPKIIPTIAVTATNPLECFGIGFLDFTFTGVPDNIYTISFDEGSFDDVSISENTAIVEAYEGTYTNLTITANDCTSVTSINASLNDPPPPNSPEVYVTNSYLKSVFIASNYTGSILWSTGETDESITVTSEGEYTVTQTVDKCISEPTLAVAEFLDLPTLSVSVVNPVVCNGTGTLNFTFTNVPNGNYTISFDGGSFQNVSVSGNSASVQSLARTYNNLRITVAVEGTSALGVNATVSDPLPPNSPTVSVLNNCGESILTASNYTGTLLWSTGETTQSIIVNVSGDYSVTQTDYGCTSDPVTATAAPILIPEISVTANNPTECQGQGSLDFTFTNVPNGTYTISYNGGNFVGIPVSNNTASVPAYAGSYQNLTIVVSGCSSPSGISTTLSDPIAPVAPGILVEDNCGESVLTATGYTGTLLWSTGETTESIIVNEAGNYSVTQSLNNCTSDAAVASADPLEIPSLSVAENNPTVCQGLGSLDFAFTGVPNGNYTISYDGGSFQNVSVSGNFASVQTAAGTYNNLRININGCNSINGVNATLNDPTPPNQPSVSIENNCGESILTASNYTGSLLWSTGETTESIIVTEVGSYSVTQTISGCTSNPATVLASPKTAPTLSIVENDPSECQGFGSIDFTFTGVPNGTYFISYDGGLFSNITVNNNTASVQAEAGIYSNLTIVVNNCNSPAGVSATLSDPNAPAAPGISVSDNCGESILTATNYTGSLLWSTGQTVSSITVTDAGTYSVTQTIGGCTSNGAIASANPKSIPVLSFSENHPEDCLGQGSLDFSFTNVPNGIYTITYDGGTFTNVSVSGSSASVSADAGTYNNLKISVNGCISANGVNATLDNPSAPAPPSVSVENDCGESIITASNYSGTLLWSTNETTESITVTVAGIYTVRQTVGGCISNPASASASPKTIPTLSVAENDPLECQGYGSIDFTFTGVPNGTYFVSYDGGGFTNVVVSGNSASVQAKAGNYNNLKIIVNSCSSPGGVNASLSDPNAPAAPGVSVVNNCGESVLTATSYTGSLLWSTGETTESIIVNETGDYSLTQIIGGCTSEAATASATPKPIPTLSVTVSDPEECLGQGSLDFTFTNVPDGTYTISYDGGSFTNIAVSSNTTSVQAATGNYNNLKINVNGCISSNGVSATLVNPEPPSVPVITVENLCGESVLTASNYTGTLLWSTGETSESITVSETGNYTVTQTVGGCVSNPASASAVPKTIPTLSVVENDPLECQGFGSIDFKFTGVPNGTYFITYDGGSFTGVLVNNNIGSVQAKAGTYSNLTIIVSNCNSPAGVSASLSDPNAPAAPDVGVVNSCGESILTAISYTGSLKWSTGETTESITVTEAGNYTLTQLIGGCTSDAAIAIAAPKAIPVISVSENDPEECQGQGSLDFAFINVPNGTYTISYDGGSFTNVPVSGNAASVIASVGIYNNLKISVNGCSSENGINATLNNPASPAPPTVSVENNCGESILTASNYTGTLSWNTGASTESIIVYNSGNYSVTQTVNNCTSDPALASSAPKTVPTISVAIEDPEVCQGYGSIDFTFTNVPNGIYFIYYDGGSFSDIVVSGNKASIQAKAGTYNNLRIIVNSCSSPGGVNASLSDPNAPAAPGVSVLNNCGESILTATSYTGSLLWSTGETTESIIVDEAGNYTLTQVIDGCTSEAAIAAAVPKSIPSLAVTVRDPEECLGQGSLDFTFANVPNGTYTISYDGGSFTNVTVSNNKASIQAETGTYNNLKINLNGCSSDDGINANIDNPEPPSVPVITVDNLCGESILTASSYTGTLLWSTGETTESIVVNEAGNYTVTQTSGGCTSFPATANVNPKIVPTVSVIKNDPDVCQGFGTLNFAFTGVPNGTYFIAYDGGSFKNVLVSNSSASVNAKAGTYNNLVIIVNNCVSENGVNATISDPNAPNPPVVSVENNCGQTVLTASNYTGTLLWNTGETKQSIVVTEAGTYTVKQIVGGCISDEAFATASPKAIPSLAVSVNIPEECFGLGSLDFLFNNVPNGNYTILYDGGSFTNVAVNNNAVSIQAPTGIYNNLRINVNGCSSGIGINATVDNPEPPTVPVITVENLCGESILTASNYTGTLLWNTGETTKSITVYSAGNYSVTQTVNNCISDPAFASTTPKTVPSISVVENDPLECRGFGSIDFTFSDVPNGTYFIFYDGGSFTNVFVSGNKASVQAKAGTYNNLRIIVNSCSSLSGVNASLSDPNAPAAPGVSVVEDCGESILTATSYTGSLLWSTGETAESIIVNETGDYTLTQIIDGCTSDAATASAKPTAIPTLSVMVNNPEDCLESGSLDFTFNNVPNGTYAISYDGGSFTNVVVNNNATSIQTEAGTYNNLNITVNGCTSGNGVNAILEIPEPPSVPVISVENLCGESILIASGYTGTLLWNTGDTSDSIFVTEEGTYTVTQTVGGCVSNPASASASPKTIPVISVVENDPLVCQGLGSLDFNFTGAPDGNYTIWYDKGSFTNVTINNSTANIEAPVGLYNNLTVIYNGCASDPGVGATLSDPNAPNSPTISVENNCGASILTASNYSGMLLWSTGETTSNIIVIEPDDYTVTQTINGCTSDAALVPVVPRIIPTVQVTKTDPDACYEKGLLNFRFTDVPDGIYSIFFEGGSFSSINVTNNNAVVHASPGTYNNLTINVNGCSSADGISTIINNPLPPSVPVISIENLCGESVLTALNYTGNLLWSTGETTDVITVTEAGNYSVTQSVNNCTSDLATVYATPKAVPKFSFVENHPTVCQGTGSIDFSFAGVPDGNYDIFYTGGQFSGINVSNSFASVSSKTGTFLNLRIVASQCSSPMGVNAKLSDPNAPDPPIVKIEDNCGESKLTVTEYSGSLLWSTGATSDNIVVTDAGDYTVSQTRDGCTSDAAIVNASPKMIPEAPDFSVTNSCNMTSILSVTEYIENAALEWSNGESDTVIEVYSEGNYWLRQILDDCPSPATTKYVEPKAGPVLSVYANNPDNCEGEGSLDFTLANVPDGNYNIVHNDGEFVNVSVVGGKASIQAESGTYNNLTITVDDCISPEGVNATLTIPEAPQVPFVFVENKCGKSVLTVTNFMENAILLWSTNETSISITANEPGTYTVTQKLNGCTSSPGSVTAAPIATPPQPDVDIIPNCNESDIIINNLVENAWFIWKTNNVSDSTRNDIVTISESGNFTLSQKLKNCYSQDTTILIEISDLPAAPISNGDKEVCETYPIQTIFAEAEPPSNNFEVVWFDQETGGNIVISPTLNQQGSITYYAETQSKTNECNSATRTPVTLTIKPNPASETIDTTIIGKPKSNVAVLIFADNTMNYQWYLNDNEINGATGQYYYIPASDRIDGNLFTVKVEADNGCYSNFTYQYASNIKNGNVDEIGSQDFLGLGSTFILYPNPANKKVFIALNENIHFNINELHLKVFSSNGSCIIQKPFDHTPQDIDIALLEPGRYLVVMFRNQEIIDTKNLIITK